MLLSPITIDEEFLYGMTTVGYGSLLLKAFGWYGSRGFFNIPACKFSLTLYYSWENDIASWVLLSSIGLGAQLLNARHTAFPFFCRTWLHEVTLVFLNKSADDYILAWWTSCSFCCLSARAILVSYSIFAAFSISAFEDAIFNFYI